MPYFRPSFPEASLPEAATSFTSVSPHLSELVLKIGMHPAIHRAYLSKLFPMNVLRQQTSASSALHLRDFGMLCPDSDIVRQHG
jgi:hypothetical protein